MQKLGATRGDEKARSPNKERNQQWWDDGFNNWSDAQFKKWLWVTRENFTLLLHSFLDDIWKEFKKDTSPEHQLGLTVLCFISWFIPAWRSKWASSWSQLASAYSLWNFKKSSSLFFSTSNMTFSLLSPFFFLLRSGVFHALYNLPHCSCLSFRHPLFVILGRFLGLSYDLLQFSNPSSDPPESLISISEAVEAELELLLLISLLLVEVLSPDSPSLELSLHVMLSTPAVKIGSRCKYHLGTVTLSENAGRTQAYISLQAPTLAYTNPQMPTQPYTDLHKHTLV